MKTRLPEWLRLYSKDGEIHNVGSSSRGLAEIVPQYPVDFVRLTVCYTSVGTFSLTARDPYAMQSVEVLDHRGILGQ